MAWIPSDTVRPLRGRLLRVPTPAPAPDTLPGVKPDRPDGEPEQWFVTVTVAGEDAGAAGVRSALERLAAERPFVVSARYRGDRAEVRYWDESHDVAVAVAQGLRMWADHQDTAALPRWRVVGLEVVDRETVRRRWRLDQQPAVQVLGEIRPMEDGCDDL